MSNPPAAAPESLLAAPDQATQDEIVREIHARHAELDALDAAGERVAATAHDFPAYRSSVLRHPTKNPKLVDPETVELFSPAFGQRDVAAIESDLTLQHAGEPLGERMTVQGRLIDSWGRPVANQLIEIWQANSAGRYIHQRDQHPPPSTRTSRSGPRGHERERRVPLHDDQARPYPWKNHRNAWRPAHIHFSVFGSSFTQRLVTQMYFPGDPLFALDPIYNSIHRQKDRDALVGVYDHDLTSPEWATGYRFDIVVDGPDQTYFEQEGDE